MNNSESSELFTAFLLSAMPYASRRQARWANATRQPFAKRWNKLTSFGVLPEKKDSGTTGLTIPPTGSNALFNQPGIASRRRRKCTCTTKAATGTPGELIEPGVRRIRGNLCNVHGRYGPCDAGTSGGKKPKGGKGRAAAKPKKTEAQRAAEREQRQTERQAETTRQQALNMTKVGEDTDLGDHLSNLDQFSQGKPLRPEDVEALATLGLLEIGSDGTPRKSEQANVLLNAAKRGDTQGARDAASRARDRVSVNQEHAARQQEVETRRAQGLAKREQAKRERETARAKRQAEQAAKKPAKASASGDKKNPDQGEQPKTVSTISKRRAQRSSSPSAPGVQSSAKPKKPAAEKPAKARIASALADAAMQLSEGADVSDAQLEALITNGLVKLNKDGTPILTAAGQRATMKEASGHTGVMIALYPDAAAAKQIAAQDGVTETTDQLHLTLAFLGDSTETPLSSNKDKLIAAAKQWAAEKGQALKGTINGLGRFFHSEDDDTNAVFVSPDVPGLPEMRQSLCDWIEQSGFDYAQNHGFTPHITVAYVPLDAPTPPIRIETPITFSQVTLAWGDERYDYPMGITAQKEAAPIFAVFKDARGADRWLGITTTAYVDVDDEIISTKAIGQAVAIGDLTQQRGPLRYWHVVGLDIGDCDYQAQGGPGGRFLIESGTFRSKGCARLGQRMAEKGYQMSPGFVHSRTQPKNGVYDDIAIYERSPVPNGRAANRFTRFATKEDRMLTTEKEAELKTLLADQPDLLNQLMAQVERTDKAAQQIGVTYKDAPEWAQLLITRIDGLEATVKAFPPAAAEAVEADEEIVAEEADDGMEMEAQADDAGGMDDAAFAQMLAQAVVQAITPLLDIEKKMASHMADLKSTMGGYVQQKDDASAAQAAQIDALDAKLKELTGDLPTSVMNGAARMYRASEAPQTLLTAESEKKLKELTQQAPAGLTDPAEIAAYQLIFGNQ